MREAALKADDTRKMQMWAGQAAKLAQAKPADEIVRQLWTDASRLLS
jgi:NAD(P)H-dependent flavin oxidoreductase YrpB (nitropropane dioxygenase family)